RRQRVRVSGAEVVELEVSLAEGTNDAIFGGGTGIDRERHTRTAVDLVDKAVALTEVARPGRLTVNAAVERAVNAQIAADLDAGVGAGNVVETRTVQRTDLHVFDRFGLHGKVGCLRPAHGDKTCR